MVFRDPNDINNVTKKTINCLVCDGGIGDLLGALMPINHLLNNSKWLNILIWVPDFLKDFTKHVLPEGAIVRNFTEAQKKYDNTKTGISTKWQGLHTPMRTHPVEYSYHVLCDIHPNMEQKSYLKIKPELIDLSKFNLPEKYVVMQGTFTEKVKTMPKETFNNLKQYIIDKGYSVVVVGKSLNIAGDETGNVPSKIGDYDFSNTINLIDKCSILETAGILSKAKLMIGMDGGLMHITGFTDTPMVVGTTFVTPEHIGPIRDGVKNKGVYFVEPDESLACRGCQSRLSLYYNHDFRDCLYSDFKCLSYMTYDNFIKQIEGNNLL